MLFTFLLPFVSFSQINDSIFMEFFESVNQKINVKKTGAAKRLLDSKRNLITKFNCNQSAMFYSRYGAIEYSKYNDDIALHYWIDSTIVHWENCDFKSDYHLGLTHFNIASSYRYTNKPQLAEKHFSKFIETIDTLTDIDNDWYANKLMYVSLYYSSIRNNYKSDIILKRVKNLISNISNPNIKGRYHSIKSINDARKFNYLKSIKDSKLALKYFIRTNDYKNQIIENYNLADSYYFLDSIQKSLQYLTICENLLIEYPSNQGKNLYKYANLKYLILKKQKKLERAADLYKAQLLKLKEHRSSNLIVSVRPNAYCIARIYL